MSDRRMHTSMVGDAHAYTRSESPWILANQDSACGKLMRYLSGGGMRAFGRTVRQEETRRRHLRFWVLAAMFSVLWLGFWIF